MSKSINANEDVVREVLKNSTALMENTRESLDLLERVILSAEINGWSDHNYHIIKEKIDEANRSMKDALMAYEEDICPNLKKIIESIDNFQNL